MEGRQYVDIRRWRGDKALGKQFDSDINEIRLGLRYGNQL